MSAQIESKRGVSETNYTITGKFMEVIAEIETLMIEYHPWGYSTKVRSLEMHASQPDTYVAKVWRANSCD